jgi:glycosyltransferase involved in cell wall biosynthesis
MTRAERADPGQPSKGPATRPQGYRVLMIAPTSFFADYGCHVRILEEVRILEKLGSHVAICTYHNGRDLDGLDIRRTMSIPWRQGYEVGSSRHKIAFDALLFLRSLGAMAQVRPQVIHAHLHEGALIGYVLSRLWRVPLVFDFQGSMTGEMIDHHFLSRQGPFYGPMRRLEQYIDWAAPRILTSSAHAAEVLTEEFRCSPRRITCVPDCVNTDTFRPAVKDEGLTRLRRAWGIPDGSIVVVYLGLLAEYQGTDHLLRAASRVCAQRSDVHFLLGGYPNLDRYRQLAAELGIAERVTFAGKVPYEEAPRFLSLGDVAVSSKLSATEGAGKLLNYMAMALPTVAFDTPVSREYLGEHGVYAAVRDADDLARRLEELIGNPGRRAELGAALRQRAQEQYSWESAGGRILGIYASVVR